MQAPPWPGTVGTSIRWLKGQVILGLDDGWMGPTRRPLRLQFADDHHAFHEDAKPRDLSLQFGIRSFNSSKKFWTRMNLVSPAPPVGVSARRNIRNR